ncbi:hypothetical protein MPSEU_000145500 [Mayamaea pseudoterrestris]|nr:hypothetical protein MPSEU_000145500 [Mayamaea pseudoterrestris]
MRRRNCSKQTSITNATRLYILLICCNIYIQTNAFSPGTQVSRCRGTQLQPLNLIPSFDDNERRSSVESSRSSITKDNTLLNLLENSSRIDSDSLLPLNIAAIDDDIDDHIYRNAIQRTFAWVGAAIAFGAGLWITMGATTGQEFFAGYLVEQSLSVDNLFVFLLLFDYFKVPLAYQNRVLNWGIYGAIIFRAVMIGLGAALLQKFHVILLVFAGILVYSSAKVFAGSNEEEDEDDPSNNQIVKFSKSLFRSVDYYDEDRFFVQVDGMRAATPLFICMVAVEISDIVFAIDSIPAVFGVTTNPLVVFSSNIFAIMGLRSLYTVLSKAATDLVYLEPAVALVLGFIGSKMILEYFGYCIPTHIALLVVGLLLGGGVFASVREKQVEVTSADD